MRTSKRDCFVRIQSRSETVDPEYKTPVAGDWVLDREAWVEIRPKAGRERNAGGTIESIAKATVVGDFLDLDGVTAAMRIVHDPNGTFDDVEGDRYAYFTIEAVNPDRVKRDIVTLDVMQVDKDAAA